MIRAAWKRNGYDDRAGFIEVEGNPVSDADQRPVTAEVIR
jgi:hypothetical protein